MRHLIPKEGHWCSEVQWLAPGRSHSWSVAETGPDQSPGLPGSLPRAPSTRPHRRQELQGRAVPRADGVGAKFGIGRDAQLQRGTDIMAKTVRNDSRVAVQLWGHGAGECEDTTPASRGNPALPPPKGAGSGCPGGHTPDQELAQVSLHHPAVLPSGGLRPGSARTSQPDSPS